MVPTAMLPKLSLLGLTVTWDEEGTVACTSFELALSTPPELTAVAT